MNKTIAGLVTGAAIAFVAPAQAGSIGWSFSNNTTDQVRIEFYSADRNHSWGNNGEPYRFAPGEGPRSMSLSCSEGEKVCYGAWTDDSPQTAWGVGRDDSRSCESCCYICGNGPGATIHFTN